MSIQCHDTVVSIRKYIRPVKTVMRCWCSGVNDWIWSCHCHPMIYLSGTDLPTHKVHTHARTHTRLMALCLSLPGTRKVKPIWILLKQETVSGSWAIWKSAPRSRQITTSAPHYSSFFTGRMPFLSPNQQRQSTEGSHEGTETEKLNGVYKA